MNRNDKKQYIALFILLMFFGSTFAIAMSSAEPVAEDEKFIFDVPLAESDEAKYFQKNMVVARVYYDGQYDTLDALANMVNTLNQKMILERIDVAKYPNQYEAVKSGFVSEEMPMILLRGTTEIYLNGEQNATELFDDICSLYSQTIDECIV